jgi:hypothetical protein
VITSLSRFAAPDVRLTDLKSSGQNRAGPEQPEKDLTNPYKRVSNVYDKFSNPYHQVSHVNSVKPDEPDFDYEVESPSVKVFSVYRSTEKYD